MNLKEVMLRRTTSESSYLFPKMSMTVFETMRRHVEQIPSLYNTVHDELNEQDER